MSRITTYTETMVVKRATPSVTIKCDRCGREYAENDYFTNEIVIAMDQDECVSYVHRRDYCGNCSADIWAGICMVIGVDPDQEGRTGFEDE